MTHVLVCPQEFKGSLNAEAAATAIVSGIHAARPDWTIDALPLADGGPGFIDAMRGAIRGETIAAVVRDPLGHRAVGRFFVIESQQTAVIEAAQANGLHHLLPADYAPLTADTRGVGDLILAAAAHTPTRMIIGVGGSATTDGGAGMAQALGARLLDSEGHELPPGGAALARLTRIEWEPPRFLQGVEVVIASDVTNPLTGALGAAAVFGPQKGASAQDVVMLDGALAHYASVLDEALGASVRTVAGAGAAGGLAAGIIAFLGGRVASGFDVVADATQLRDRLERADIVITGEGRYDSQTAGGKGPGRIVEMAQARSKRVAVFAGAIEGVPPGVDAISLLDRAESPEQAMEEAGALLTGAAAAWAAELA